MKFRAFSKVIFFCAITAFMMVPEFSHAGNEGRGGENALVCVDSDIVYDQIKTQGGNITDDQVANHVTSAIAYDLYQAQRPRGDDGSIPPLYISSISPASGKFTLADARLYLENIAHRFDSYVPGLSKIIRDGVSRFPPSAIAWELHGVLYTNDSSPDGRLSPRCILATLASQDNSGSSFHLNLDKRFFDLPENKHSSLSKAVMFLHEAVYSHARENGQVDSKNTRELVRTLITQNKSMTIEELIIQVDQLGLGFKQLVRHSSDSQNRRIVFDKTDSALSSVIQGIVYSLRTEIWSQFSANYSQGASPLVEKSKLLLDFLFADTCLTEPVCVEKLNGATDGRPAYVKARTDGSRKSRPLTPEEIRSLQRLVQEWNTFRSNLNFTMEAFGRQQFDEKYFERIKNIAGLPENAIEKVRNSLLKEISSSISGPDGYLDGWPECMTDRAIGVSVCLSGSAVETPLNYLFP